MRGNSDADSGAESISVQQKSLVDMDEDYSEDSEEVSTVNHFTTHGILVCTHPSDWQLWVLITLGCAHAASTFPV